MALTDNQVHQRTAKFYPIGSYLTRLSKDPSGNFILVDFVSIIVRYLIFADNRSFKGLCTLISRYLIHGTITLEDLHFRVEVQHSFGIPGETSYVLWLEHLFFHIPP